LSPPVTFLGGDKPRPYIVLRYEAALW
jgi:hypothetical protein